MNARVLDRGSLEREIAVLVADYEALHATEVSSIWIEHYVAPRAIEITVTTHAQVNVA